MIELRYQEIIRILDGYDIKYQEKLGRRGDVSFNHEEIRIDPSFNEDVQILLHEFAHIYYEEYFGLNLPEEIIERASQHYLNTNPTERKSFEDYLDSRIDSRNKKNTSQVKA